MKDEREASAMGRFELRAMEAVMQCNAAGRRLNRPERTTSC